MVMIMKSDNDSIKKVTAMFDEEDLKYIKSKYYLQYLKNEKENKNVKKLVKKNER